MSSKSIKFILLLLALILTILFFVKSITVKKELSTSEIFLKNQKILGMLVKKEGVRKAYAYFRSNFKNYDPSTNHYLGHFLGEEAYRVLGEKGFDVCDFGLDYGCTHGFVIAGISERGEGFFKTVMDHCKKMDSSDIKRSSCI